MISAISLGLAMQEKSPPFKDAIRQGARLAHHLDNRTGNEQVRKRIKEAIYERLVGRPLPNTKGVARMIEEAIEESQQPHALKRRDVTKVAKTADGLHSLTEFIRVATGEIMAMHLVEAEEDHRVTVEGQHGLQVTIRRIPNVKGAVELKFRKKTLPVIRGFIHRMPSAHDPKQLQKHISESLERMLSTLLTRGDQP